MFYPSSIIACYSGEELRLWHMAFEDYHMHYFKDAIDGKRSTPNLIYLNKYCWSIALIALMGSANDKVKTFLKENLNIDDLNKVDILIEFAEVENFKNHTALRNFGMEPSKNLSGSLFFSKSKTNFESS